MEKTQTQIQNLVFDENTNSFFVQIVDGDDILNNKLYTERRIQNLVFDESTNIIKLNIK